MVDAATGFRRIYLLRHGETHFGASRESGYDLTERGYHQIQALAELFMGVQLDAIYSSPLGRALATARTIAQTSGVPITTVEELCELRSGDLSGMDRAASLAAVLTYWLDPEQSWDEPYVGGGETFRQLRERVLPIFDRLVEQDDWRRIAVVAHGGVNSAILGQIIGMREPGLPRIEQDFGCVNIVDLIGESPVVRVLNFTAHDPLKASMEAGFLEIWYQHTLASFGLAGPEESPS